MCTASEHCVTPNRSPSLIPAFVGIPQRTRDALIVLVAVVHDTETTSESRVPFGVEEQREPRLARANRDREHIASQTLIGRNAIPIQRRVPTKDVPVCVSKNHKSLRVAVAALVKGRCSTTVPASTPEKAQPFRAEFRKK
jgi:hypothetical protein